MQLEPLIISAPFANYLRFPGTTPTYGTFTWQRRGGWPWRLWRVARTVRYSWQMQSWRNQLGLPNPGLRSLDAARTDLHGALLSVYGFSSWEWHHLVAHAMCWPGIAGVELNLSCPNVMHLQVAADVLPAVVRHADKVVAKLPPLRPMELAAPLYEAGVRVFHCSNTLWTPGGGLSGPVLQPYSLWAVETLKTKYGDSVTVIGGGGVRTVADVRRYKDAGADHVAIGSMLLNPWNWRQVPVLRAAMREQGRAHREAR